MKQKQHSATTRVTTRLANWPERVWRPPVMSRAAFLILSKASRNKARGSSSICDDSGNQEVTSTVQTDRSWFMALLPSRSLRRIDLPPKTRKVTTRCLNASDFSRRNNHDRQPLFNPSWSLGVPEAGVFGDVVFGLHSLNNAAKPNPHNCLTLCKSWGVWGGL